MPRDLSNWRDDEDDLVSVFGEEEYYDGDEEYEDICRHGIPFEYCDECMLEEDPRDQDDWDD